MVYNRFSRQIVLRVTFVLANVLLLGLFIVKFSYKELVFLPLIFSFTLIWQIIALLIYIKKVNTGINDLFKAIYDTEFTDKFMSKESLGDSKEFLGTINKILSVIEDYRLKQKADFHFLDHLIEHLPVGFVCFNNKNEIVLSNLAAKNMLGLPEVKHIHQITDLHPEFSRIFDSDSDRRFVMDLEAGLGIKKLSIIYHPFKILDEDYSIIIFQDIKSEMDMNETDSYQKLIKVLRHEIMNSATPITSLTETVLMILEDQKGELKGKDALSHEDIEDIRDNVKVIQSRSDGLFRFVQQYRDITQMPKPVFNFIDIKDLLEDSQKLLAHKLEQNSIECIIELDHPDLKIKGDRDLIHQVIINILKNSIDALRNITRGRIVLKTYMENTHSIIEISDNGIGILQSQIHDVFVPFFTTKEDGSGIGLSFCRQVMMIHNGNISISSSPDIGTTVKLDFVNP